MSKESQQKTKKQVKQTQSDIKNRTNFGSKFKAILKSNSSSNSQKITSKLNRSNSGKKVTWKVDDNIIQPGEEQVDCDDQYDSFAILTHACEENEFVVPVTDSSNPFASPDLISDNCYSNGNSHVIHHKREYEILDGNSENMPSALYSYDPTYSISKNSHKRSSSLPAEELENTKMNSNHKRFASFDNAALRIFNPTIKNAWPKTDIDWTKQMQRHEKPSITFEREFLSAWTKSTVDYNILEDLTPFMESEDVSTDIQKINIPELPDDQVSMVDDSEISSIHTFVECDDRLNDFEISQPWPFSGHSNNITPTRPHYVLPINSSSNGSLNLAQNSRKDCGFIALPQQNYEISIVCEIMQSSEITLSIHQYQSEIIFEKNNNSTVQALIHPRASSLSSSLPHIARTANHKSYDKTKQYLTLPVRRAKRHNNATSFKNYYLFNPNRNNSMSSSGSQDSQKSEMDVTLSCDKSTGQLVLPSPTKRINFASAESLVYSQIKGKIPYSKMNNSSPNISPKIKFGKISPSRSFNSVHETYENREKPYLISDQHFDEEQQKSQNFRFIRTPNPIGMCCQCNECILPSACHPIRIKRTGLMYHPDCFRCSACYKLLNVFIYYELKGKLYCYEDFTKHVTCHVCNQSIQTKKCGQQGFVSVYDNFIHIACFRCSSCGIQLDRKRNMSFDGRWLHCIRCAHARCHQTLNPNFVGTKNNTNYKNPPLISWL